MRILFVGDVMGRSGRDAIAKHLPELKDKLQADVTIVNVDNAASGRGVTKDTAQDMYDAGAECLTGGDHIWDQREMISVIDKDKNILRPLNLPEHTPGQGVWTKALPNGHEIVVIHICGTIFMSKTHFDAPFECVDGVLKNYQLKAGRSIFVDFHAEATSEKMAMAQYLDGRVSAVVGTHTHIPTADCQIFNKGTAYQTDAGMCGDYDSVIGVRADVPIRKFLRNVPLERLIPAAGEATLCGTLIVTDDKTGLAKSIEPVRIGGRLSQQMPDI
ncbi:MAG: TIGR00282 family metallophosphoesterase [Alphaproteobacteria bacterium]|nr:TIGR00282 family metallophosphoesterase [Alphaproteobacteria bacterium]